MLAFLLSIGLFLFWTALGYAVLACVGTRLLPVRNLLVAPAVGMVLNSVPLILLSMAGFPLARVALPVGAVLLVLTIVLWWAAREPAPAREYLPFLGVILAGLLVTGAPMLRFGFDWISFCNDDMANYVMGAQRLLDHAYFDVPTSSRLLGGYDYTEYLYFLHVPGMHRPGSEMLIAFVSRLAGISTTQAFMPVIVAMHLVLISGTAAMAYAGDDPRRKAPALAAAGLVALSALTSLGTLYQLIAQVGGLCVLAACATLLMRPFDGEWTRGQIVRNGALLGLMVAGLAFIYPELAPFFAVGCALYFLLGLLTGRLHVGRLSLAALVAVPVAFVLLNRAVPTTIAYILRQNGTGAIADDASVTLFPYFLMPTGLANLWGFQRVSSPMFEPFQSTVIAAGLLMSVAMVLAAIRRTWQGSPAATLTVVMLGVGAYLFQTRSGFGLFKLAMFVQPFMLATVAAAWFDLTRGRLWRWPRWAVQFVPLAVLAAAGLDAQIAYIRSSAGTGLTFGEIPDASGSRILAEMNTVVRDHPADHYLIDSYNIVLAKLQTMETRGQQALFPSNRLFHVGGYKSFPGFDAGRILRDTSRLVDAHVRGYTSHAFDLHDGQGAVNDFSVNGFAEQMLAGVNRKVPAAGTSGNDAPGDAVMVATTAKQNVFNRRRRAVWADNKLSDDAVPGGANFYSTNLRDARNHLIFVASERGMPYFAGGGKAKYALFQLETEPLFFKGRTMAGVGRHLLFQVVNPTPTVRVVMEFTSSYRADMENALPPAAAVGATREALGMIGRGSARVVSPPLKPQLIGGLPYVAIDMGEDGRQFPTPRTGLMNLYGRDVSTDRRKLVGFIRDVSVISEDEYKALQPPSRVGSFGRKWFEEQDLLNPGLEYSGMYEDSWVSGEAFFNLGQPAGAERLVVRGQVPVGDDPDFELESELLLDGVVIARAPLRPGSFTLSGSAPYQAKGSAGVSARRVDVRFSRLQRLAAPDSRPVGARIFTIGFEAEDVKKIAQDVKQRQQTRR